MNIPRRRHFDTGTNPDPAEKAMQDRHPRKRRQFGLQLQFQIALGLIFTVFCALTAGLIYSHEKRLLEQTALSKSHMVMAAVESTRAYIRETLRPKMYEFAGPDTFLLEAMSTSYVTRAVMDRFNETLPDYRYRRVAVAARNPESTPTAVEMELIRHFQQNPGKTQWQGMREVDGTVAFFHARPVVMRSSCLKCHGRVEDAPDSLVQQYGDQRGFGYRQGQLAGVMAVSIPVNVALKKIQSQALSVFWVSLLLLLFLYILISFLFNRMAVRHLRGLLDIFRHGLVDDPEHPSFQETSTKVEIDQLTDAALDMTRHLRSTREELKQYTARLEQRVAERTRDLEFSRAQLQEKVLARNRELKTLNQIAELITRSFRLSDILPAVLEQTLGLIPAQGAAIYLLGGTGEKRNLKLECSRNADKLDSRLDDEPQSRASAQPQNLHEAIWAAASGETTLFACKRNLNCLNIPLVCRERVLGVMTFVGVDFNETSQELQDLLMSIGHQIGITVESLQNVSALLQHKELLQSVFDGIPDEMVLLDRDLTIRMVNKAYMERHRTTIEAVAGRPCRALQGCECPLAGTQLQTALNTRQQTKEEVRTKEGEIFQVYYYLIPDDNGQIWGIIRYAKNITLEKQVEQRIQQTEKLAALGQLAAGVAHEINNPIGIILCYTALLKRQLDESDQKRKDIDIIEKHAVNCRRIVSDLLKFSRDPKTEPTRAQVNTALSEVVEMVRQQFQKNGTRIDMELDEHLPLLYLDVDKMKQVFLNLLMNAHHAVSPPDGRIQIRSRYLPAETSVEISFADNGSGIAAEIADRIFDPFFSTKGPGEGTGLGLSVSYGIVKNHNGDIRMTTQVGTGSEFVVQLPVPPQKDREI